MVAYPVASLVNLVSYLVHSLWYQFLSNSSRFSSNVVCFTLHNVRTLMLSAQITLILNFWCPSNFMLLVGYCCHGCACYASILSQLTFQLVIISANVTIHRVPTRLLSGFPPSHAHTTAYLIDLKLVWPWHSSKQTGSLLTHLTTQDYLAR